MKLAIANKKRIINPEKKGRQKMSIVIIGGNERMVCQYQTVCKSHGCKAKVFVKENGALKKKLGRPDLMILFTNTVSHKMVECAICEAKRNRIPIERAHSSSTAALKAILAEHCARE